MPRARNIKPAFFLDEEISECHPLGRLLFQGLWTLANYEGNLEDRPKRIKATVLPYDNKPSVEDLLDELTKYDLIVRYQEARPKDGKTMQYIHIPGFKKHQHPTDKEVKAGTDIPRYDLDQIRDRSGEAPVCLKPETLNLKPETLSSSEPETAPAPKPSSDAVYLRVSCVGNPGTWELTKEKLNEWHSAYGDSLDVLGELRKAKQWTIDNPTKRKTARGMTRYLGSWLNRAVNNGTGAPPKSQAERNAQAERLKAAARADEEQKHRDTYGDRGKAEAEDLMSMMGAVPQSQVKVTVTPPDQPPPTRQGADE